MKFDIIIHECFKENIIDYGIIKGNEIIFFIKSGQNGSMYGYKNKYLDIAQTINKKYGYTVICSSNPFDGNNPLDNAFLVIENYAKENNFKDYKIYYMGHSNGGLIGIRFGINYPKIKRMLLINTPLMINIHKTKESIRKFKGEKLIMVYGSLDESNFYTELLKPLESDIYKLIIIKGQDHYFSKNDTDFKSLPEKYLL